MNPLSKRVVQLCLRHLRQFTRDFDDESGAWLAQNESVVATFLADHLDCMKPSERLAIYGILFGFFRDSYEVVLNARLRTEEDSKCLEELRRLEESHRTEVQEGRGPMSDEEFVASNEEMLAHSNPRVRYVGALVIWHSTKDFMKIVPVLRTMLQNKDGGAREEAAELLAEVRPLDRETLQTLQQVADDKSDPARGAARKALKAWRNRWRL